MCGYIVSLKQTAGYGKSILLAKQLGWGCLRSYDRWLLLIKKNLDGWRRMDRVALVKPTG